MRNLIYFLFFLLPFVGFGQITLEKRLEFDLKDDERIVGTYPIGNQGLITLSVELIKGASDNYILTKYDTDLQREKSVSFQKEPRLYPVGNFTNEDTTQIVFLFENKKEWIIKKIDLAGFEISEDRFSKEDLFFRKIEQLNYCINGKLFFRGIRKKKPAILILDLENRQEFQAEIPGINRSRTIESFEFDSEFQHVLIFQRDGKDLKKAAMNLLLMDLNGSFSDPLSLDTNPAYSIIDGEVTWLKEDAFVIAGTYGLSGRSLVASGYYIARYEDGRQLFITYHSFTDFDNFFKYLPERTQKKIEKKKNRKSSRGQTDFIKTRIALHPVEVLDGMFRIVGEVFYPTYRTETYTTTGANGQVTTSTRQVFDGYQYSHAAILDVDQDGAKLKDYCFTMFLFYKPFSVVLNLRIKEDKNGNMFFIYANGSNIKGASISADQQLSESDFGTVSTEVEGDKVRYTYSRSIYWYDNVYLLVGNQTIKNKENENVKRKRTVYYINKISYQAKW